MEWVMVRDIFLAQSSFLLDSSLLRLSSFIHFVNLFFFFSVCFAAWQSGRAPREEERAWHSVHFSQEWRWTPRSTTKATAGGSGKCEWFAFWLFTGCCLEAMCMTRVRKNQGFVDCMAGKIECTGCCIPLRCAQYITGLPVCSPLNLLGCAYLYKINADPPYLIPLVSLLLVHIYSQSSLCPHIQLPWPTTTVSWSHCLSVNVSWLCSWMKCRATISHPLWEKWSTCR